MRLFRTKNTSVFVRWLISYSLILIIPINFFIYFYSASTASVQKEIDNVNRLVLSKASGEIDVLLQSQQSAYLYAFTDTYLRTMCNLAPDDPLFTFYATKLMKSLDAYHAADRQARILVFFKNRDFLLTNSSASQLDIHYNALAFYYDMCGFDQLRETLGAEYRSEYFFSDYIGAGTPQKQIVYANSFRLAGNDVNIFVTVPAAVLLESAKGLEGSMFALVNEHQEIISRSYEAMSGMEASSLLADSAIRIRGVQYVCTRVTASTPPWTYIMLTPKEDFWQALNGMNKLFIFTICGVCGAGLLCGYFVLRHNYKPVGQLVRYINPTDKGNEFDLITRGFDKLKLDLEDMSHVVNEQTAQLRSQYLLSKLKRRDKLLQSSDALSFYHLDFERSCFVLVGFASTYDKKAVSLDVLMQMVNDRMREYMAGFPFYPIEDGELLLYLFELKPEQNDKWMRQGEDGILRLCDDIQDDHDVSMICVVSDRTDSFDDVGDLYETVLDAIEYKRMIGEDGMLPTRKMEQTGLLESNRSEYQVKPFAMAIRSGDKALMNKAIDHLFSAYEQNSVVSFAYFRILVVHILDTSLKNYCDSVKDTHRIQDIDIHLDEIFSAQSVRTLKKCLTQSLLHMCESVSSLLKQYEKGCIDDIKEYIIKHYRNNELNISLIAQEMNKSPKQISYAFRTQTGMGILDYINSIRIAKAKQLLINGKIKQEELITLIGYTNVRTFRRAYQKFGSASAELHPVDFI